MPPKFEKQGILRKQGGILRRWKTRWFVLSHNTITYCQQEEIGDPEKLKGALSLIGTQLRDEEQYKFRVQAIKKSYVLEAESDLDKQEWMQAIQGSIDYYAAFPSEQVAAPVVAVPERSRTPEPVIQYITTPAPQPEEDNELRFGVLCATSVIGEKVCESLIAGGNRVRAIVRNPLHADAQRALGCEVVWGDFANINSLVMGMTGCDAVFIMMPPVHSASGDVRANRKSLCEQVAKAVQRAKTVKHVVILSCFGAHLANGTGIATLSYDLEQAFASLTSVDISVITLRAAYLYENFVDVIDDLSTFPTFFLPHVALPCVAAQDVGETAADLLVNGDEGGGLKVVEIQGPEPYSHDGIARLIQEVTGKSVELIGLEPRSYAATLQECGVSENVSNLMQQFVEAVNGKFCVFQKSESQRVRGKISLRDFIRELRESG